MFFLGGWCHWSAMFAPKVRSSVSIGGFMQELHLYGVKKKQLETHWISAIYSGYTEASTDAYSWNGEWFFLDDGGFWRTTLWKPTWHWKLHHEWVDVLHIETWVIFQQTPCENVSFRGFPHLCRDPQPHQNLKASLYIQTTSQRVRYDWNHHHHSPAVTPPSGIHLHGVWSPRLPKAVEKSLRLNGLFRVYRAWENYPVMLRKESTIIFSADVWVGWTQSPKRNA